MSRLRTFWQNLAASFDRRNPRERALLAAAFVLGGLLVGNALFVDPMLLRAKQAQRQGEQQSMEADGLAAQAKAVGGQLASDPDAPLKAALAGLQGDLAAVEGKLKALEDRFVPPEQMNGVLENLLASHHRLRLVSLRSLSPVNLAKAARKEEGTPSSGATPASSSNDAPNEALGLYKHGVELRIEGSYADLHAWLAQLESSQRRLLWGDIRFNVIEHPRSQLTLTVYTLSTDRSWLSI